MALYHGFNIGSSNDGHLCGANPLLEPMLTWYQLVPYEKRVSEILIKNTTVFPQRVSKEHDDITTTKQDTTKLCTYMYLNCTLWYSRQHIIAREDFSDCIPSGHRQLVHWTDKCILNRQNHNGNHMRHVVYKGWVNNTLSGLVWCMWTWAVNFLEVSRASWLVAGL